MKILVIGTGGREHALVWKLAQSEKASEIYTKITPALSGKVKMAGEDLKTNEDIVYFVNNKKIDLVVIGPEAPLANGLADALIKNGTKVFGPVQSGARLESSKEYSKDFMIKYGIPTAGYRVFSSSTAAKRYLQSTFGPVVVKADGLAAGKGVRVCKDALEAIGAVEDFMEKDIFSGAGHKVVLEDFIQGPELSVMAFVDGNSYALLPASRDHKRLLDKNEGPNTGGMGAFCPVEGISEELMAQIKKEVFDNVITGLKSEGVDYCGIIYAGLMLTKDGPKTLEFNCRFGDPETQVLMPMLKTDLLDIISACVDGRLNEIKVEANDGACVTVTLAAENYPLTPKTGDEIKGLSDVDADVMVFHAGTKTDVTGAVLTAGGRVLNVTARAENFETARQKAYKNISKIKFNGMQYRTDIGVSYDD